MTREETAAAIKRLAERVGKLDYSFDIQVTISAIERVLIELRHVEGLKLLTRISLLLLTANGTTNVTVEYAKKRVDSLEPINPAADSAALRSLAEEIRGHARRSTQRYI